VRGAGVDHPRTGVAGAVQQRHGGARRVIGQAQDHAVGCVDDVALGRFILGALARQADDLDVAAASQPLADLESGGAVFAVDEDFRSAHGLIP
jgi:hypothetical protein